MKIKNKKILTTALASASIVIIPAIVIACSEEEEQTEIWRPTMSMYENAKMTPEGIILPDDFAIPEGVERLGGIREMVDGKEIVVRTFDYLAQLAVATKNDEAPDVKYFEREEFMEDGGNWTRESYLGGDGEPIGRYRTLPEYQQYKVVFPKGFTFPKSLRYMYGSFNNVEFKGDLIIPEHLVINDSFNRTIFHGNVYVLSDKTEINKSGHEFDDSVFKSHDMEGRLNVHGLYLTDRVSFYDLKSHYGMARRTWHGLPQSLNNNFESQKEDWDEVYSKRFDGIEYTPPLLYLPINFLSNFPTAYPDERSYYRKFNQWPRTYGQELFDKVYEYVKTDRGTDARFYDFTPA